jgi:hypothetical protein
MSVWSLTLTSNARMRAASRVKPFRRCRGFSEPFSSSQFQTPRISCAGPGCCDDVIVMGRLAARNAYQREGSGFSNQYDAYGLPL